MTAVLPCAGFIGLAYGWGYGLPSNYIMGLATGFAPLPFIYMLWLRIVERDGAQLYGFSLPALLATIACSCFAASERWPQYSIIGAIIASLFILVRPVEALRRVAGSPRLAIVAAIGAGAIHMYEVAQARLWEQMCHSTAQIINFFLNHFVPMNIALYEKKHNFVHVANIGGRMVASPRYENHYVVIGSDWFSLNLFPQCSGLEGVCLFFFLLSAMVMLDWKLFQTRRLFELYLMAFLYMFLINALRISAFFLMGYWAWAPDATAFAQSMRDAPLMLFHTWVGWVVYLGAFGFFITRLYGSMALSNGEFAARAENQEPGACDEKR
jgi:exosortase/archaeosortase family protein